MNPYRSLSVALGALLVAAPLSAQAGSFGNALVIDGDRIIASEPNNSFRAGLVYVYEKSGDEWVERERLMAPDSERQDGFGATLALSGNALTPTAALAWRPASPGPGRSSWTGTAPPPSARSSRLPGPRPCPPASPRPSAKRVAASRPPSTISQLVQIGSMSMSTSTCSTRRLLPAVLELAPGA